MLHKGLALFLAIFTGISCTTTVLDHEMKEPFSFGGTNTKHIRTLRTEAQGSILTSCLELNEQALKQLKSKIKNGQSITKMRYFGKQGEIEIWAEEPLCTTAWGWAALSGVGLLLPYVRTVKVKGVVSVTEPNPAAK